MFGFQVFGIQMVTVLKYLDNFSDILFPTPNPETRVLSKIYNFALFLVSLVGCTQILKSWETFLSCNHLILGRI